MPDHLKPRPALFSVPPAAAQSLTSPAVGIVMRTRDRPLLLRRALGSVLGQTLQDWRLCIVNDGGEPAPVNDIVRAHEPMLAGRASVLHIAHSNGMEAASNRGLREAGGRYFAIHDDDDAWHPDFLHRTSGFLDDTANAAFVGAATRAIVINERIEDGVVVEVSRLDFPFRPAVTDLSQLLVENRYPPIALLFRSSLLNLIGGYNEDLPVLGDWDFNMRAALSGDIASIDAPLAYYHHRHTAEQTAYGNTVTAGHERHLIYDTLLRNSIVRLGLRGRPEMLALLQPLLYSAKLTGDSIRALQVDQAAVNSRLMEIHAELHELRTAVEMARNEIHDVAAALRTSREADMAAANTTAVELREVAAWHTKLLWPARMLWRSLRPLPRPAARLKGRD